MLGGSWLIFGHSKADEAKFEFELVDVSAPTKRPDLLRQGEQKTRS